MIILSQSKLNWGGVEWSVYLQGSRRPFHLHTSPNRLCGAPSLHFDWYRCPFLGVKRPECDVDHSPPSSDDVDIEWSYMYSTLLPSVHLRHVRHNCNVFNIQNEILFAVGPAPLSYLLTLLTYLLTYLLHAAESFLRS